MRQRRPRSFRCSIRTERRLDAIVEAQRRAGEPRPSLSRVLLAIVEGRTTLAELEDCYLGAPQDLRAEAG